MCFKPVLCVSGKLEWEVTGVLHVYLEYTLICLYILIKMYTSGWTTVLEYDSRKDFH